MVHKLLACSNVCHPRCLCEPNMGGMQPNTAVSIEMFIDYKLENYMFQHFVGHRQVFSKITQDNSIYSACAHCVDGQISTSRLYCVIWRFLYWNARGGVWLDSAKGAFISSSVLGMLVLKKGVPLLFLLIRVRVRRKARV